ncbi:hypothetical protein FA13DRAFT_1609239, partial [Coprinellus micaceus]
KVLCPGLTVADDPKIPSYLGHTAAIGGGARAVWKIAKEKFKRLCSGLKKKEKKVVLNTQYHERTWKNDHANLRVFSMVCEKEVQVQDDKRPPPCAECKTVLKSKAFRNILRKKPPKDENYKH